MKNVSASSSVAIYSLKTFVLDILLIDVSPHFSTPWRYSGDVAGKS